MTSIPGPIKGKGSTSATKTEEKRMMGDATGIIIRTPGDGAKGHHPSPYTSTKMGSSLRCAPLIICFPGKKLHSRILSKKGGGEESKGITTGLQRLRRSEGSAGVTEGKDR